MNGLYENLLQILESLNVPIAFVGVLLTVLLALTLAPFLGGLKVGPVEIPKLPLRSRQGLMVGTLLAWVVLLAPLFPAEPPPAPCLLQAAAHVEDPEPQEATLDAFLGHFQTLMADQDIPVHVEYGEDLVAAELPQRSFTLHRKGDVAKSGCLLLTEIGDGLNRVLVRDGEPLRIAIYASCNEVHVSFRDAEPPAGDFIQCS